VPRYLIERTFPDGLSIPLNEDGRKAVASVIATNADHGVTWVHSYVTPDRKQTSASTTVRPRRRSARWPNAMVCRSPHHRSQRARPVLLPFLTLN